MVRPVDGASAAGRVTKFALDSRSKLYDRREAYTVLTLALGQGVNPPEGTSVAARGQ
jgi:hypothetical protein